MSYSSGENKPLRALGGLFTFILICLFAVMSIFLVVLSAQAYRQVTENAQTNAEIRTSIGYIEGKLRAYDGLGVAAIKTIDGTPVLALEQETDGEKYITYIYCYQGILYEMLVSADAEFYPDQGETLVALESLGIVEADNGYTVTVTDTHHIQYTRFVARHSQL
jgi:hypothetical protein